MNLGISFHQSRYSVSEKYEKRGFLPVSFFLFAFTYNTIKEIGKGTGLGLSISYGIITEMAGTLAVRNGEQGDLLHHQLARAREHRIAVSDKSSATEFRAKRAKNS